MDGHGGGRQVEVVKEDGQVIVEAPRRPEPDVKRAAGHAFDGSGDEIGMTTRVELLDEQG